MAAAGGLHPARFQMTAPARAALRSALATGGTAFAVGAAHVSQPFLAVLAAQLTAGIGFSGSGGFVRRVAASWAGTLLGLGLLTALPDQTFFSLPAFGILCGFIPRAIARRFGLAEAILFCMGFCGMFAAGIVYPAAGVVIGTAHAISLGFAVALTFVAQQMVPLAPASALRDEATGWELGASAVGSLVAACAVFPDLAVVSTIAALATALTLPAGTGGVVSKLAGGLLGTLVSYVFLIIVSGAGNDVALFLLGLAAVIGGFEWGAVRRPALSALFRQAGALFAVAATILPRPMDTIASPTGRLLAVLLGLAVAAVVHLAARWRRE